MVVANGRCYRYITCYTVTLTRDQLRINGEKTARRNCEALEGKLAAVTEGMKFDVLWYRVFSSRDQNYESAIL